MVAKFLEKLTCTTFLCVIALSNYMVAHTFLPSLDNANGHLCQEILFEILEFCYQGNVYFQTQQRNTEINQVEASAMQTVTQARF